MNLSLLLPSLAGALFYLAVISPISVTHRSVLSIIAGWIDWAPVISGDMQQKQIQVQINHNPILLLHVGFTLAAYGALAYLLYQWSQKNDSTEMRWSFLALWTTAYILGVLML